MELFADQQQGDCDQDAVDTVLPWKLLDCELHELPTAVWDSEDVAADWTYLVDLDCQRFVINNWIVFDLCNIPRGRWTEAFSFEGWTDKFSLTLCPEASDVMSQPRYFANDNQRLDCYVSAYQQHAVSWVNPRRIDDSLPLRQLFTLAIFHHFMASQFPDYLPATPHDTFAFREAAYAVLSLATGNFYFDAPSRYFGDRVRERSTGFLVGVNDEGDDFLMPIFGAGCHMESQEPGSSPSELVFWFRGVLISLVPDNAFDLDLEAVIGKAVSLGRAIRTDDFQIVIFSIQNAVLLEVCQAPIAVIRRSDIIPICGVDSEDRRSHDESNDTDDGPTVDRLLSAHSGFVALQDFFTIASRRNVSRFGRGRLPTEIYANILKYCDVETHNQCTKVSRTFQSLCSAQFPFSRSLNILKLERCSPDWHAQGLLCGWSSIRLAELGNFHFYNTRSGVYCQSPLAVGHYLGVGQGKMVGTWCPIIGNETRPSILTQVPLRLLLRKL